MNEIASFVWSVGDIAETIGLHGCSVIALCNDRAIVWGHFSPVMENEDGTWLDSQQTLDLALGRIESKARSMGILGAGQAKGVLRVDHGAATLPPPPGVPNIPLIIRRWYEQLGVTNLNAAVYNLDNGKGTCRVQHVTLGNVAVKMF
jgi:hypothetical protein